MRSIMEIVPLMMKGNKKQYNLRIEKDLLERLKSLAVAKGTTVTNLILKAIKKNEEI